MPLLARKGIQPPARASRMNSQKISGYDDLIEN
jgi:hypothetical protein